MKANKGKPGVDGMAVEEACPYLREHQKELTGRILKGKYTPSPVRRVEIPKPEGGVRKLGIPTVIDRTIQQAIAQHELLINLLRKNVEDERVDQLIKRYLKSGVMENGVVMDTEEGSPQGQTVRKPAKSDMRF